MTTKVSTEGSVEKFCTRHRWCLERDKHDGACRGLHNAVIDMFARIGIKLLGGKP